MFRSSVRNKFDRMVSLHTEACVSWCDGIIECVLKYFGLSVVKEDLTPNEKHLHNLDTLHDFIMNTATVNQLNVIENIADENPKYMKLIGFTNYID